MASPKGNNVSVSIEDSRGYTAAATAYAQFGATDTVGAITTALQAWLAGLNNVIGGKILGCRYELEIGLTGGVASKVATAGAPLPSRLQLNFPHAGPKYAWGFAIPTLDPSCEVSGGPDMTEGATIDLFADSMEAAIGGTTGGVWITSTGDTLSGPAQGRLVTRKDRKAMQSGSKRPGA